MGYRVKELRESMGLSQEELARISGVSRTIISGLENGTTRATTTKTLIKLAEALGCTVDCIFLQMMFNPLNSRVANEGEELKRRAKLKKSIQSVQLR